jgi:hypothetical protein
MTKFQLLAMLKSLPGDAQVVLNCWPADPSTCHFDPNGPGVDDLFEIDTVDIHEREDEFSPFAVINARIFYSVPKLRIVK